MTVRVRRPRQTTIEGFDILYIEGAAAPWRIVPHDRSLLPAGSGCLHMTRLRRDAVAYVTSGAAGRRLAVLVEEVAA